MVGNGVYLLLVSVFLVGIGLRQPNPGSVGLWSVFGLPLRFYLALVELLGPGVFFEQLVELLQVFGWVSDAVAVQDADAKTADCIMDFYVVVNGW